MLLILSAEGALHRSLAGPKRWACGAPGNV